MDPITEALRKHYADTFARHGATSQGVDWDVDATRMLLRYDKMLAVIDGKDAKPSVLDVGCGYGGLRTYAAERGIGLDYTGIDIAESMVQWAQKQGGAGTFVCGDV